MQPKQLPFGIIASVGRTEGIIGTVIMISTGNGGKKTREL